MSVWDRIRGEQAPDVTVIQRIINIIGGDIVNFPGLQRYGIRQAVRARLIAGRTYVGAAIRIVLRLFVPQRVGLTQTGFRTGEHAPMETDAGVGQVGGMQDGTVLVEAQQTAAGLDLPFVGLLPGSTSLSPQLPGWSVLPYAYLERCVWVDVATESAASDWNDLAESEGDSTDTGVAFIEEGLFLTQGSLIGDFPNHVGKDGLNITQVRLRAHYAVTAFLLVGTTLSIQYRIGALGVPVNLKTLSGGITVAVSEDHLVDGEEFDITALGPTGAGDAWTWTALNDIQIVYVSSILVDVGATRTEVNATQLCINAETDGAP